MKLSTVKNQIIVCSPISRFYLVWLKITNIANMEETTIDDRRGQCVPFSLQSGCQM